MYSAAIRSGVVEVQGDRTASIRASDPHVEAIALEHEDEDHLTIHWSDGSASVHSLPSGEVIRKL